MAKRQVRLSLEFGKPAQLSALTFFGVLPPSTGSGEKVDGMRAVNGSGAAAAG